MTIEVTCAIIAVIPAILSVVINIVEIGKTRRDIMKTTLRSNIVQIYHMYKDQKDIPLGVYDGMCNQYDDYVKFGGNSYVHALKKEMDEWHKY